MSTFGGLVLTNKGKNLQSKAQAGVQLNYTRIGIGDGDLGSTSILDLNTLKNEIMSLGISKLKVLTDGRAVVGTVICNQDMTEGFYFREIGLYANDPDLGEILYCYGNAGDLAEYISAGGGTDVIEKSIDIQTVIGNAENVTAVIDESLVYATKEDLENIEVPVTSVNSKTGAVQLSASDVGAETPTGAQEKANTAESNAKDYADQEVLGLAGEGNTKTVKELDDTKVDEVAGKGLSTEDYTTAEKDKLAGIESNAQRNTVTSVNGKTGAVSLNPSDVGAVPTGRTISAGTGLTGGGSLASNRIISVIFGTGSNEVARGNHVHNEYPTIATGTFTGNGTSSRQINHGMGKVPDFVLILHMTHADQYHSGWLRYDPNVGKTLGTAGQGGDEFTDAWDTTKFYTIDDDYRTKLNTDGGLYKWFAFYF